VYTRRSRCPPFLFISDEHIVKQSNQVCYKLIFINSLFIIYHDFLKIFNIGWTRKSVDTWEKLRVKAATFLTGLPQLPSLVIIFNLVYYADNCSWFPWPKYKCNWQVQTATVFQRFSITIQSVQLLNDEQMMVHFKLMMAKCSIMMAKGVYNHTLISPSLTTISPSLSSILPSLAWGIPSFAHLTIIEELHRLICTYARLPYAEHIQMLGFCMPSIGKTVTC